MLTTAFLIDVVVGSVSGCNVGLNAFLNVEGVIKPQKLQKFIYSSVMVSNSQFIFAGIY